MPCLILPMEQKKNTKIGSRQAVAREIRSRSPVGVRSCNKEKWTFTKHEIAARRSKKKKRTRHGTLSDQSNYTKQNAKAPCPQFKRHSTSRVRLNYPFGAGTCFVHVPVGRRRCHSELYEFAVIISDKPAVISDKPAVPTLASVGYGFRP